MLKQLKDACSLNHIEDVNIMGLTWGVFSPGLLELEPQDFILASDCFYDSKGMGMWIFCLILGINFLQ